MTKSQTTDWLIAGGVLAAVGAYWWSTRTDDVQLSAADQDPMAWERFLLNNANAEDRQIVFYVLGSLYGRGHSQMPPTQARVEAIRLSGQYDADAVSALARALGRSATGSQADLQAYFRQAPAQNPRALPFAVTPAVIQRMQQLDAEVRAGVRR